MPVQAAPLGGATAAADETSVADRTYAKAFWRLVAFLMLCYVVAYPMLVVGAVCVFVTPARMVNR